MHKGDKLVLSLIRSWCKHCHFLHWFSRRRSVKM